jgi:hypothetical protein
MDCDDGNHTRGSDQDPGYWKQLAVARRNSRY